MTAIARETNISKSYLEQLAIPLKSAGLLHGRTGRAGGYTLARPAADIRVLEIVEAAIGPIDLVECVGDPDICLRASDCETRLIWALITSRTRAMLDEYSLADLTDPQYLQSIREQIGDDLAAPQQKVCKRGQRTNCGPEPLRSRGRRRTSSDTSS